MENIIKKSFIRIGKKIVIVDSEDYPYLSQYKWSINKFGYVRGRTRNGSIGIHREINKTPKGFFTDHINHNKLDNRKRNLRTVTPSQSLTNRRMMKNNKSGYKGVYWNTQLRSWQAKLNVNKKMIYLGSHKKIMDAVRAYDLASKTYHGEFGLNNQSL